MADIALFTSEKENDKEYGRMLELEFRDCGLSVTYGILTDETKVIVGVCDCPDEEFIAEIEDLRSSLPIIICFRSLYDELPSTFIQIKRPIRMSKLRPYMKQLCLGSVGSVAETAGNIFGRVLTVGNKTARYGEEELKLSSREFALLRYLYLNQGRPVTKEEILKNVWGDVPDIKGNTPEVYINYLRKKIDLKYDVKCIVTVRNIGYMLKK